VQSNALNTADRYSLQVYQTHRLTNSSEHSTLLIVDKYQLTNTLQSSNNILPVLV